MRALWNRLRDLFRRDSLAREAEEELRFHHEMLARDARALGTPDPDAGYAARRRLGNRTRLTEELRAMWGFGWMDEIARNVRYTFRGLARSPGFTAAVVLTLGLGIGANAAMFGVIDRLMFRPYPYLRDPGTVHRVYLSWNDRGRRRFTEAFEYARYLDLRKWTSSFSRFAAFSDRELAIGTGEATRERQVYTVNASFFDFFDARPALGRFFVAAEDSTPRGADVAVLSWAFWQSEFGGRRDVLDRVLQIGNIHATIIGVAPRGFVGVDDARPPVAFIPITTYAGSRPGEDGRTYYTRYNWGWMAMMVRRKPGVSVAAASADLSQAHVKSWDAEYAIEPFTPSKVARPAAVASGMKTGAGPDPGLDAKTALWVGGVAGIVLLIACANVANLFLARAMRRRREVALRLALGVSLRRLLAQSLTESTILALIGCAAGILIAQWGGAGVRALFLRGGAPMDLLTDWRTIGAAALFALVAGALTGLAPVLLARHGDLAATLKAGAREGSYQRSRARTALLVLQGALSVVLLVGAGLFVRSLDRVRGMRLGYDADRVLVVAGNLRGMSLDSVGRVALGARVLEAAESLPDVEHAAWVSSVPFWSTSSQSLFVEGIDSVRKLGRFTYETATPDYFATMGTRIVRGRSFSAADRAGMPRVAVVSEGMARVLWPGKNAIGRCMRVGRDTMPCTTVIGIAEDMFQRDLTEDRRFHYYLPIGQHDASGGFALLARTRGEPKAVMEGVRRSLQKVMPGQAYVTVQPLGELVDGARRSWRMGATMFAAFGLLALAVAAVGMYGVIAYNVAQRTQELGVRVALGAQRADILRLVISEGMRYAAIGIAIGGALSLASGRWVQPLLFRQSPRDPAVYGVVAVLLFTVALTASALPALRAARADPNEALRAE
jgi:predicted permease